MIALGKDLSQSITGQSKDFLGVALTPRLWKLAQLIVPLGEINRLNPGGVFGKQWLTLLLVSKQYLQAGVAGGQCERVALLT